MKQLTAVRHELEFRFFNGGDQGELSLCLVKSRFSDYPVIMGKLPDGTWTCVCHAPVVTAHLMTIFREH